jgi:branched-chain amino acid transport system permease protein
MTSQALVIGLVTGAAYGLVALGLVLVYKSSGVLNFAQGEFGTVAVYALWLATSNGVPYLLAIVLALAVAAAFGFVTERAVVRPLADAPRVTVLVATVGVALLAIGLELWIGQPQIRPIRPALARQDRFQIAGVYVSDQRLLILATVIAVAIALRWMFTRTSLGLAVLAASEEPTGTRLMGVRVERLSTLIWVVAALLGGAAGILTGPISGFGPGFLTQGALVAGFTAAVIGGFTSLPGAFLGGVIVGVIQSAATSADWLRDVPGPQTAALFVLLVVILLARPQGILGKAA